MKKIFFSLIVIMFSTCLFSEGVEFSGDISTSWGVFAPWTNKDTAGDFSLGDTNFTGKVDAWYGNSSAFAEGKVSYDALTNSVDFSLGEVWADYTSSFWGIRIGRQKVAWGKADGIDITNVVCPGDMSSIAAMTSDDSKLPVNAIRLSFSGNQFTADAFWIPFFTPAVLPAEKVAGIPIEKPELAIWNGEYGLKFSGYFSMLDVSFYGFYGWEDTPFVDYKMPSPPAIIPSAKYKHMAMVGLDTAIPIGPTVLRSEAAFFPKRNFQKDAQTIVKENMTGTAETTKELNQLKALIGLDWMPSGWTLTAQYFCDYVFGNLDNLDRKDAYTHGATLSISKSLLNETMDLSLAGVVNLNAFDSLINPSLNYSLSDQINIKTGAYILLPGPDEDGTYGAYKDYSSIYINVKFSI
jgi:hypothetical protein